MKRLTQEQKNEINRLSQYTDLTQKEIAREVGCSITAVRAHSYRPAEEENESQEEEGENITNAVSELYERMLEMKDKHIEDLKEIIGMLAKPKADA